MFYCFVTLTSDHPRKPCEPLGVAAKTFNIKHWKVFQPQPAVAKNSPRCPRVAGDSSSSLGCYSSELMSESLTTGCVRRDQLREEEWWINKHPGPAALNAVRHTTTISSCRLMAKGLSSGWIQGWIWKRHIGVHLGWTRWERSLIRVQGFYLYGAVMATYNLS